MICEVLCLHSLKVKPFTNFIYHDFGTGLSWKLVDSSTNCWDADWLCTNNFCHLKNIYYTTFQQFSWKIFILRIVPNRSNCVNNITSSNITTSSNCATSSWNDSVAINPFSRLVIDNISSFVCNSCGNSTTMIQFCISSINNCTRFLCDIILNNLNYKNLI